MRRDLKADLDQLILYSYRATGGQETGRKLYCSKEIVNITDAREECCQGRGSS
jgi:hypothetical protein